MSPTARIPDDLAKRLAADGGDIERRALEALALEEYRAGRLTRPELRRMLGFETRAELDGFLKERGVALAGQPMTQPDAWRMIRKRAAAVEIFRAGRESFVSGDGDHRVPLQWRCA